MGCGPVDQGVVVAHDSGPPPRGTKHVGDLGEGPAERRVVVMLRVAGDPAARPFGLRRYGGRSRIVGGPIVLAVAPCTPTTRALAPGRIREGSVERSGFR